MPDIVLRTAKRLWSKESLNHLPVTTEKNIFQSPYNLPEFSTVESQYILNFPDAALLINGPSYRKKEKKKVAGKKKF